ncbi:ATP-dependent RNA helicase DDX23 [Hordeum vulgare]|nr:ATP-dependent RNA helicase DDX23 [Hordeum vulgare]
MPPSHVGLDRDAGPIVVAKPRDRFRFDWASTDDTSRVDAANNQPAHDVLLLYGRGFLAGIDRREQKKVAAAALQKDYGAGAAAMYGALDMRVDMHWTDKRADEMTERDRWILRKDFGMSYRELPRAPAHEELGEEQARRRRRDVIGIAQTGSGKTAAFVLPMLAYIAGMPPPTSHSEADEGPYALVLAPTRELAQQIERETVKLVACLGIRVVSIVGGKADDQSTIQKQASMLKRGCEVIVATPDRLLDCLESMYAILNRCNYVVLDEADRMIDMGFEPQVVGVLDEMPPSHLKPENTDEELDEARTYMMTHMFSATMPPAMERLARKNLRNPVAVTVGFAGKAADLLAQNVVMVKVQEKMPRLTRILADLGKDRRTTIVFCNTKNSVEKLTNDLEYAGLSRVTALHGGKSQDERKANLDGFRNGRFNALVATDLAARGIDVPEVAHVINYEMPSSIDLYTHRIGRTRRARKKGLLTSFLTMEDTDIFYELKQMLVQSNSPVPPELARHDASRFKPGSIPGRPPRRNGTVHAYH